MGLWTFCDLSNCVTLNVRVKKIQSELGTQILADFEEVLSVKGIKVCLLTFQ